MSKRYFDQGRAGNGWKRRDFLSTALVSVAAIALPRGSAVAADGVSGNEAAGDRRPALTILSSR